MDGMWPPNTGGGGTPPPLGGGGGGGGAPKLGGGGGGAGILSDTSAYCGDLKRKGEVENVVSFSFGDGAYDIQSRAPFKK